MNEPPSEYFKDPALCVQDTEYQENAMSTQEKVTPVGYHAGDFQHSNGDIESRGPDHEGFPRMDARQNLEMNGTGANGSTSKSEHQKTGIARQTKVNDSEHVSLDTKGANVEDRTLSQTPSVSAIRKNGAEGDNKDIWLIRFSRLVSAGLVGSMSALLCGKRRK